MKKEVLKEEVDQILSQSFWGKSGVKLTESATQEETQEVVEGDDSEEQAEVATHTCPLCESQLEEDISDENLTEHIQMMLGIINEMNDISDEELESIEEELDAADEDEGDEVEDDDELEIEEAVTPAPEVGKGKLPKKLPRFMKGGAKAKKY